MVYAPRRMPILVASLSAWPRPAQNVFLVKRCSYLEKESLFLQALVLHGIEAEELGGAVGAFAVLLFEGDEEVVAEDFFAEIALVDVGAEDAFVEALELGEGELGREELEADGLVGELATEAGEGGGEDLGVVEGERGDVANGEPAGLGGICGGGGGVVGGFGECVVGDADDALAGIAVDGAESVELLEEKVFEAGFFFELAAGSVIEGFFDADESAGESPVVFEGGETAADEEDLEGAAVEAEDDAVHGECGSWVFIGVFHTRSNVYFTHEVKMGVFGEVGRGRIRAGATGCGGLGRLSGTGCCEAAKRTPVLLAAGVI